MAISDFKAETPENYEQKCLCVLALDTSGSMVGDPIKELNRGLQEFRYQVIKNETAAERLEVSIISLCQRSQMYSGTHFGAQLSKCLTLEAFGSTQIVRGFTRSYFKGHQP